MRDEPDNTEFSPPETTARQSSGKSAMNPRMETPHARLRAARVAAGHRTAKGAAEKFGFNGSTYAAHENGQNGMSGKAARDYAAAFNTTAEWLLFATVQGVTPAEAIQTVEIDPELLEIWQKLNIRQRKRLLHIAKVILDE